MNVARTSTANDKRRSGLRTNIMTPRHPNALTAIYLRGTLAHPDRFSRGAITRARHGFGPGRAVLECGPRLTVPIQHISRLLMGNAFRGGRTPECQHDLESYANGHTW